MTITEAYGVGWTDGQVDGGVMDKGWITGPSGVFHAKGFTILSCGKWGVVDFCAGEYLREAGCDSKKNLTRLWRKTIYSVAHILRVQ